MGFSDQRVKRRLLRELIDENVDLISGARPSARKRKRSGLRSRAAKTVLMIVAPMALFASTLVISGAVPRPSVQRVVAASTAVPATAHGAGSAAQPATAAGNPPPGTEQVPEAEGETIAAADDPTRIPTGSSTQTLGRLVEPEPIDGSVFPLAVRRIVIDPGHGGGNLGTRIPGGLEEKLITLDIGRKVAEDLRARGFEVLLTRDDDTGITLEERAALANRKHADIFVSVHVNWLEGSRDSGIETYFLGATDDPFLTRLAARENRDSGHTMAELRQILDGIYAGVRNDKSQDLAEAIHRSMVSSLRRVNPELRDRGVKTAPFLVLVDTQMPAVLAEVAALSNQAEAEMLEKPLYRDYIADSLAAGILSYAESLGRPVERTADQTAPPDDRAEAVSAERLARSEAP